MCLNLVICINTKISLNIIDYIYVDWKIHIFMIKSLILSFILSIINVKVKK